MTRRIDTLALASALEQLAEDRDRNDGVAAAAMEEAAARLRELAAIDAAARKVGVVWGYDWGEEVFETLFEELRTALGFGEKA